MTLAYHRSSLTIVAINRIVVVVVPARSIILTRIVKVLRASLTPHRVPHYLRSTASTSQQSSKT